MPAARQDVQGGVGQRRGTVRTPAGVDRGRETTRSRSAHASVIGSEICSMPSNTAARMAVLAASYPGAVM